MKNILTKYYNLDEETKELLPFLYMYDILLDISQDYKNVKIENLADEEILMQTAIKCWYSMDMDPLDIINNLLSILNCQDITIKDFENLEIDELKEIFAYKEASDIIDVFEYKGYLCVLCKSNDKFLLIIDDGKETDTLVFDSLKEPLSLIIKSHIIEKSIYEGKIKDACSDT